VTASLGSYTYGPVPSRRLGRSLGVDLVPFKTCTYDCTYCQLGPTTDLTVERAHYVPVEDVVAEVGERLAHGVRPDIITLAGSGEPTLHAGVEDLIGRIKQLTDVPVAVLTNGSLLWMPEVAEALLGADLIMPSLDAGDEHTFLLVNRPHASLSFERMVEGLADFTAAFEGEVWLEVLLLAGITGTPEQAARIGEHVGRIGPDRVQLNTAYRPPAEAGVRPLSIAQLEELRHHFPGRVEVVAERPAAGSDGGPGNDLDDERILALLSRRPCTIADIASGLGVHAADVVKHVEALRARGRVETLLRDGRTYYAAVPPAGDSLDPPGALQTLQSPSASHSARRSDCPGSP